MEIEDQFQAPFSLIVFTPSLPTLSHVILCSKVPLGTYFAIQLPSLIQVHGFSYSESYIFSVLSLSLSVISIHVLACTLLYVSCYTDTNLCTLRPTHSYIFTPLIHSHTYTYILLLINNQLVFIQIQIHQQTYNTSLIPPPIFTAMTNFRGINCSYIHQQSTQINRNLS